MPLKVLHSQIKTARLVATAAWTALINCPRESAFMTHERLQMQIGTAEWSFDISTPVLKAAEHSYMFALGGGRFYSVLLAKGVFLLLELKLFKRGKGLFKTQQQSMALVLCIPGMI